MKKRKTRRAADLGSLAECEICRDLPDWKMIDTVQQNPFSPEADRLIGTGEIRRCPICGTSYSFTCESDTHHFMSWEQTIRRLK